MEKLTLKQAIIVEGKYDKIKLSSIVNSTILTTGGFSVFNNNEYQCMIRRIAQERGIIILTDSDSAGFLIRNKLKNIIGSSSCITNIYIPEIFGKEKRKNKPSKENKLGVEGMNVDLLYNTLKKYTADVGANTGYTKSDLYALGLSGHKNSASLREEICIKNDLPKNMSSDAFLEAINILGIKLN